VRYLILSDIHANIEALNAVLEDAQGNYDKILCCGDLVGYGADPNAVVEWARASGATVVRGNHDKACTGLDDLEWFNPVAKTAALWTQDNFSMANLEYTRTLPKGPLTVSDFQLVHGSPHDEDEYVLTPGDANTGFDYAESRIIFFGHTHVQGGYVWNHSRIEIIPRMALRREREFLEIDSACAYLLNCGSVGQPRDGDPRAAYLFFDPEPGLVTYRRVTYDVEAAQKKIREAGLPPILADRLAIGR
jgi:predicted phosphodiesterase